MKKIQTPLILKDYLSYLKSIRGLSKKTISEYNYDLINFISLISDISFIAYIIIKEKKNNQKCLLKYSTKEYLVTNMVKIYNTNLQIKLNLLSFIFFIHNEKSLNIFILFSSLKSININSTHCLY